MEWRPLRIQAPYLFPPLPDARSLNGAGVVQGRTLVGLSGNASPPVSPRPREGERLDAGLERMGHEIAYISIPAILFPTGGRAQTLEDFSNRASGIQFSSPSISQRRLPFVARPLPTVTNGENENGYIIRTQASIATSMRRRGSA